MPVADPLAETVTRRASCRSEPYGSWLLVLGADGAQQLIGATIADPGRCGDVAGMQAGSGGALLGD
jgi:hypothetical protein